jgi:hypothetical protein
MTTNAKTASLAIAILLAAVFATTVWPTRYRYDHVNLEGTVLPVRMDRFTGRTEVLRGMSGWTKVAEGDAQGETDEPKVEVLPPEEEAKVTGNAGLAYGTLFQGKLYNGSTYDLREIVITLTAREPTGEERWSRQFKDKVFIKPLTTGDFQIEVTGAQGAKLSWGIDSLKGKPSR